MSSFYNTNHQGDRVTPPPVLPPVEKPAEAPTEENPPVEATLPAVNAPIETTATPPAESAPEAPATPSPTVVPPTPVPPKPKVPPRPAFTDDRLLQGFNTAHPMACGKLNRDLQLGLDPTHFIHLQELFGQILRREPTIGELRLLCALHLSHRERPHRVAVSGLNTDSEALSETWTHMMTTHETLCRGLGTHESVTPPCTLEDALLLIPRYLRRRKSYTATDPTAMVEDTLVLSAPAEAAVAVAAGYKWVAEIPAIMAGEPPRQVYRRYASAKKAAPTGKVPSRTGDLLIAARRAPLSTMEIFLETTLARGSLCDIRPIAHRSPLHTVLDLCPSADLFADRFRFFSPEIPAPKPGRLAVDALCHIPTAEVGYAHFILRIPAGKAAEVCQALGQVGVVTVVLGSVSHQDNTILRAQVPATSTYIPVVTLPSRVLREAPAARLCTYRVEATRTEPSPAPEVNEVTYLSLQTPGSPETIAVATAALSLPATSSGYGAAQDTVTAVTTALTEAGIPKAAVTLSVSIICHEADDTTGLPCPGSRTLEAICGLYQVAAEQELWLADPSLMVEPAFVSNTAPGDPPAALTLTVTAWAYSPALTHKSRSRR